MKVSTVLIPMQTNCLQGGVEIIVTNLCRALPKRGWNVVLGLARGARFNDDRHAAHTAYRGCSHVVLDGTAGTRQGRIEALVDAIRAVKPAVVFSPRLFDAYLAVEHLKRRGATVRLVAGAMNFESQYIYDAFLYQGILDGFVTMGELARQTVIRWGGLDPERVRNIPGGVVPPKVGTTTRSAAGHVRLLYAARISRDQKRVMDLAPFLDEMERLAIPYRLDIVGSGEAESELREAMAARMLDGRVTCHGWQSSEALYERFFPAADFLVHFAHTEGLPTAPREAMAHGVVPVIAAYEGIYAEGHFRDGVNALIFPVGQLAEAAARLGAVWTKPGEVQRLSHNAAEAETGRWLFDGVMDTWAEFFDWCMSADCQREFRDDVRLPTASRLDRLTRSPWLGERIRRAVGRSFVHDDPGSEWPVSSWLCFAEPDAEIRNFASDWERQCRLAAWGGPGASAAGRG
jgi:glycosyltransferase involved in cell wall biosynthesis